MPPSLPLELIDQIIDFAIAGLPTRHQYSIKREAKNAGQSTQTVQLYREGKQTQYKVLLSLMMVNRSFHGLATAKLCRNIVLRHQSAVKRFSEIEHEGWGFAKRLEVDATLAWSERDAVICRAKKMSYLKEFVIGVGSHSRSSWTLPLSLLTRLESFATLELKLHGFTDDMDMKSDQTSSLKKLSIQDSSWMGTCAWYPQRRLNPVDLILSNLRVLRLGYVDHCLSPRMHSDLASKICGIAQSLRSLHCTWTGIKRAEADQFSVILAACTSLQTLTLSFEAFYKVRDGKLPLTITSFRLSALPAKGARNFRWDHWGFDGDFNISSAKIHTARVNGKLQKVIIGAPGKVECQEGLKRAQQRYRDKGITLEYEQRDRVWDDWL